MSRGTRASRALVLVLLLAGLACAESRPYRGWDLETHIPREDCVDETLPNGTRVLVRVGANGPQEVVAVAPEGFKLAHAGSFPEGKRYREAASRGESEKLAEILDKVLARSESGSELVRPPWDSPVWVSARAVAREHLLSLPPEGRAAYRKLRDDEATPQLETAARAGDGYALESLLDRFPAASTAGAAAIKAGDIFLEQGELLAALRSWERALREYPGEVDVAAVESRIALGRLLEASSVEPPRPERAGELRVLWRRKVTAPEHAPPEHALSGLPPMLARAHEDRAYVQDARGVLALELETGRLVWRASLDVLASDEDPGPATVSAEGDAIVCVRGRRRVFALEAPTGRVLQRLDVKKDLGGAATDRIDAAVSERGRLYVLASLGGDRVLLAFERNGTRVFRTELWPTATGKSEESRLVVGHEGILVLAEGGLASLDRSGDVRWARAATALHLDPGRSCERDLVRAADELVLLDHDGLLVLDAASGERRSLPPLPRGILAVATGDEGPVWLWPQPPRDEPPQLLGLDGRHVLVIASVDTDTRPVWGGTVERGVLWLPGERDLAAFELASGKLLGRCSFGDGRLPGRLSAAGSVVLSTSADGEVAAFAQRPLPGPLAPLPEDPAAIVSCLSSGDDRVRRGARQRLCALGSAAKEALQAALSSRDVEVREDAAEILPALELTELWERATKDLSLDVKLDDTGSEVKPGPKRPATLVDRLLDTDANVRLRALRGAHGRDKDPTRPSTDLVSALKLVLAREDDDACREEALAWLVARDKGARSQVLAVLLDPAQDAPGREAAAAVLVNSEALHDGNPGQTDVAGALSSPRDEVRAALYRALLRHGGVPEKQVVDSRLAPWRDADGKERPQDPVADRVSREVQIEAQIEAATRRFKGANFRIPKMPGVERADPAEERRALLERVKLGDE